MEKIIIFNRLETRIRGMDKKINLEYYMAI